MNWVPLIGLIIVSLLVGWAFIVISVTVDIADDKWWGPPIAVFFTLLPIVVIAGLAS